MTKTDKKKVDCAVALSYALEAKVPIITASGRGLTAKRIKEAAKNGLNDSEIKEKTLDNQQVYKEDIYEQQAENRPVVNKYQQYYNENYNRGKNKFSMQRNFDNTNVVQDNSKKLEFTQENIVRGLIANEYLNKNSRRGR